MKYIMADYRNIFTLCVEHEYYMGNMCSGMEIRPISLELMKRRELVFKQTEINKWSIIGNFSGAGIDELSDVLILEVKISDNAFIHFTDWKGYDPVKSYQLDLPTDNLVIEAIEGIKRIDEKRKGNVLFTIYLRLSNKMFERAKNGKSVEQKLVFHAAQKYIEYLCIPRNREKVWHLKVEETSNKVVFGEISQQNMEAFGGLVYQVKSISKVPLYKGNNYIFRLKEIVRENPLMERILVKQLPYSSVSDFITEDSNIIRQVCYY